MGARNTFAATRRSHAILQRLRQGEGVTIEDVSSEFDVQYPQARADLKLLEELYDLNTYRRGRTKVWEMPNVNTKEAAVGISAALELGAISLDVFKDTPYGQWIDEHSRNWRNQVGEPFSERLHRFQAAVMMRRNWMPAEPELLTESLEEILDGISLRRGLKVRYERSDGTTSSYLLIPRRVIWYHGRLWLQAIDMKSREERLYDIAGIRESWFISREKIAKQEVQARLRDSPLPEKLSPEEIETRQAAILAEYLSELDGYFRYQEREVEDRYFADAFGIYGSGFEPRDVEIIVRGSWVNYLRRYRLHPSQENEELDDGIRVRFRLGICPEFRSFLLGMIPDVEVVGPQSLRDELHESV